MRLGEYNTSSEIDCITYGKTGDKDCNEKPVHMRVEEEIPHPGYDGTSKLNDIALLRLAEEVNYTGTYTMVFNAKKNKCYKNLLIFLDFIKPVCLPHFSEFSTSDFQGENLTVAGWGQTATTSSFGTESQVLLKVNVSLMFNFK